MSDMKPSGNIHELNRKASESFQAGRYEEALEYSDEALRMDSRNPALWSNKAAILGILQRYLDSLVCYDEALRINPQDPMNWFGKGTCFFYLKNPKNAQDCFEKVILLKPTDPRVWDRLATMYQALGNGRKADECRRNAEALAAAGKKNTDSTPEATQQQGVPQGAGPDADVDYLNMKALEHLRFGRPLEAIRCLDKALLLRPGSRELLCTKGIACRNMFREEDAQKCYRKVVAEKPEENDEWFWYTQGLLALGMKDEAAACMTEISRRNLSPNFLGMLTHFYRQNGMAKESGLCEKFLRRHPGTEKPAVQRFENWLRECTDTSLLVLFEKASNCHHAGDYRQALRHYDELLHRKPDLDQVWTGKGECHMSLGDIDEAVRCFRTALSYNPALTIALTDLGATLGKQGKVKEAEEAYQKALQLEPDRQYIWQIMGVILAENGLHERGIGCLDQAIALDPDWTELWLLKGNYLSVLCRYDKALSCYTRATEINPASNAAWALKGQCLIKADRVDEAKICFERAKTHFNQKKDEGIIGPAISIAKKESTPPGKNVKMLGPFVDYGIIGRGGFGTVVKVYDPEGMTMYALKSFSDCGQTGSINPALFRKEADIWVRLGHHPNIVTARGITEIGNRLYIIMDYVPPDPQGCCSLESHIRTPAGRDTVQILRWAVQICHGMEHAYSRGLSCHRDLKSANVLIGSNRVAMITDFGLAGYIDHLKLMVTDLPGALKENKRLSAVSILGQGAGTLTHMSPEQFRDSGSCDQRSDIYSFGVMLYEMAAGGKVPFLADTPREFSPGARRAFEERMYDLHCNGTIPVIDSPLFPVIRKCMAKRPSDRYATFPLLRKDLEEMYRNLTGREIPPTAFESEVSDQLIRQGYGMKQLRRYDDAIAFFDRALEKDPISINAIEGKAQTFMKMGRLDDAVRCYEERIGDLPDNEIVWYNLGLLRAKQKRYREAIQALDRSIELGFSSAEAFENKGNCHFMLDQPAEAFAALSSATRKNPDIFLAWKIMALIVMGKSDYLTALQYFDNALRLEPDDPVLLNKKARVLAKLSRFGESIVCVDRYLAKNPSDGEAQKFRTWLNEQIRGSS